MYFILLIKKTTINNNSLKDEGSTKNITVMYDVQYFEGIMFLWNTRNQLPDRMVYSRKM